MRTMIWILFSGFLLSCSGKVVITEIDGSKKPTGIVIQKPAPTPVEVAMLNEDGDELNIGTVHMTLPDSEKFLDLCFVGPKFGKTTLDLQLNPNGTLKSYSITRDPKVAETLETLSDAADSITDTVSKIREAKAGQETTTAEDNEELAAKILQIMLQANLDALEKGEPLPYPDLVVPASD